MKSKLLLVLTFFIFFDGLGQTGFEEHVVIDNSYTTDGAESVYAIDIDNDGDNDVLVAAFEDNKIGWYENVDGLGTFDFQRTITLEAINVNQVLAADLDNDGDIDVLSATRLTGEIAWYENIDGIGTFGAKQTITTNSASYSIHTGDIDDDGDIDIISGTIGEMVWYENIDGTGNFEFREIAMGVFEVNSVYSIDIDADGDLDIICAFVYKIVWYENMDGQGNFDSEKIITEDAIEGYSVYPTDIDGDGDMDVLSASSSITSTGDDKIAWYENIDGLGTFGNQQIITIDISSTESVHANDIDNDGDIDVISTAYREVIWYENIDGLGNFGIPQIITNNVLKAKTVFTIDLDNDGDIDVLSASSTDNKIAWYENTDGLGEFSDQKIITTAAIGLVSVLTIDIDNDGDLDIISASDDPSDGKVAWYENLDGNGTFGRQQIITTYVDGVNSAFPSDIDGDGDFDMLSGSSLILDDKIAWYENLDGLGNYDFQQVISTNSDRTESVFAADIDNDGDKDVFSASYLDNKIAWYENLDGQGDFSSEKIISTNALGAKSVYAIDIDNDGDGDVISASGSDAKIAWYENIDGQGSFSNEKIISTNALGAKSVYAIDIDKDGDTDIISASSVDAKIAWYENIDGQGNFSSEKIITDSLTFAYSVFAADIDNDGDVDVLGGSSNWEYGIIGWYENIDGQGNFSAKREISSSDLFGVKSIYSSDMDGDGDMDVLAASWFDGKIVWYENQGVMSSENNIKENHQLRFSIFPIPTSGILTIQSKTTIAQIEIYDQLGQLVLTKSNADEIDLSHLNRGFYYCKVRDKNGDAGIKKVVKD